MQQTPMPDGVQKNKHKIWFGYKVHDAVDMKHGIITKALVTPANILDFQVFDELCPAQDMVCADKLYGVQSVYDMLQQNNCASGIIQKNSWIKYWRSSIRMPFESTFSKQSRRASYRGLSKVQFQFTLESIVHNLKKAVRLLAPQLASPPLVSAVQG